jgi:signal transduction histidine kinase
LRREVVTFEDRANVVFLAGLPMATVRKRLADLGADAVVYSPGLYADSAGGVFTPAASVRMLAAQTAVPIYGPFDTFIGTGAVGGYMPSFATIGQRAGQIVSALLDGASPSARSLMEPIPTALNVDWRQVRRLGIDEKAIPGDAIVRFREPSAWEEYRNEIVITIVALVVQAQLIVWLLVERRRRRKAQHAEQGLRTELAHGARLAMAGELIGSIAHEINQPLGAILSNADTGDHILESDADPRAEMRAILADIRRDDLRASEVILRLRKLLSTHEVERRPLDVNHAALDVEPILRAEAKRRGVALAIETAPEAAMIVGDRIQIQQVIINLVLNAMDAERELPDDRRRVGLSIATSENTVTIAVRDWGRGIAPEDLPKIFESFFTTKQEGMGLGLSITRSIVEAHGGRIRAENRSPGALFLVDLPMRETLVAATDST